VHYIHLAPLLPTVPTAGIERPWDLRRIRPHFFPRGASVVFGKRADTPGAMPDVAKVWTGRLKASACSWAAAKGELTRKSARVKRLNGSAQSEYEEVFTQGVTLSPRFLFVVNEKPKTPLGLPAGRGAIVSSRGSNEKAPWKNLPSVDGVVESEFVRPLVSGETLVPYRLLPLQKVVLPCNAKGVLGASEEIEVYPGLSHWWHQAEKIWNKHRSNDRLTLMEQLNYQSKLAKQLPVPALRIVYNASGMHLCAAPLEDRRAIVAKSLYWAAAATAEEADYVCAILNSPATTEFARPYMSYGKDERHFDKHIWLLPIPRFDPANGVHTKLSAMAREAHKLVADFALDPDLHFAATRRHIRAILEESPIGKEMNDIIYELLS
jgi:hypothetical protein